MVKYMVYVGNFTMDPMGLEVLIPQSWSRQYLNTLKKYPELIFNISDWKESCSVKTDPMYHKNNRPNDTSTSVDPCDHVFAEKPMWQESQTEPFDKHKSGFGHTR